MGDKDLTATKRKALRRGRMSEYVAAAFLMLKGYRILALKPDGREGHDPFVSVHLEKKLHPYEGDIGED